MDRALVDQVRSFNRTVTQQVGALAETYLARGRPLGQARLLWEIGAGDAGSEPDGNAPDGPGTGVRVRELRERLGLDSGYVSRLLRALEADGLVTVLADPRDARVRTARLTAAGLAERAELDRRSDEAAAALLSPLNPRQRARLTEAMAEVERLLTASMVEIAVTDPLSPPARACLDAYFGELAQRFEHGFEPPSQPGDAERMRPPRGLFLVATLHGQPVGCAGLRFEDGAADVKRMWVAPAARGLGLGRRLLAELERQAVEHGFSTVRLETNRVLAEAIALYRASGYREVEAFNDETYAHHWFAKQVSQ